MRYFGIMQGRLVFPVKGQLQAFPIEEWEMEFPRAAAAGLSCIEWIYDCSSEDVNPLCTVQGIARLRDLSSGHGVRVHSLCADYFMEKPLVRVTESEREERLGRLEWLLSRCQQVGITRVVLPFVDQSAVTNKSEESTVLESLRRIVPPAERLGVELHLEMSLDPEEFRAFLARLPHPFVKVNYDTGNSASLGYRPQEEFVAYGERIGSVHIKDRKRGGGSVPLGTGDVDFTAVFAGLRRLQYRGDFILQTARGAEGDEMALATQNRAFVSRMWSEAS